METLMNEPQIPWARIVAFVRQHTHDVRNGLNCLDLEKDEARQLRLHRITAARRTIAKYREEMNIASSRMRKQY